MRYIYCRQCDGTIRGDWNGAECQTCGLDLHPAFPPARTLHPNEVLRFDRAGYLVAVEFAPDMHEEK